MCDTANFQQNHLDSRGETAKKRVTYIHTQDRLQGERNHGNTALPVIEFHYRSNVSPAVIPSVILAQHWQIPHNNVIFYS